MAVTLLIAAAAIPTGYVLRRPVEVPVAGTVTLNGEPLHGADVSFFDVDSYRRGCTTDYGGMFAIPLLPGSYQVAVTRDVDRAEIQMMIMGTGPPEMFERAEAELAKLFQQVNERYGDWNKSGLVAKVRDGKRNDLVFELTTAPAVSFRERLK